MAESNRTKYLHIALLVVGIVAQTGTLSAQEAVKHLNPVIEKLAAGKPFIGFQTGDLSLQNARTLARADIDYVYLEMEHGPMDFAGLHRFTVGMIDKSAILKKGNAQPIVAIFGALFRQGQAGLRGGGGIRRKLAASAVVAGTDAASPFRPSWRLVRANRRSENRRFSRCGFLTSRPLSKRPHGVSDAS